MLELRALNQASGGSVTYRCRTGFRDEVCNIRQHLGGVIGGAEFEGLRTLHEPPPEILTGWSGFPIRYYSYEPLGIFRFTSIRESKSSSLSLHNLACVYLANLGYLRSHEFITGGFYALRLYSICEIVPDLAFAALLPEMGLDFQPCL